LASLVAATHGSARAYANTWLSRRDDSRVEFAVRWVAGTMAGHDNGDERTAQEK